MRRRSGFVALFAVFLHAFAPLLASAAPRDATYQVELCTAHGTVTVVVDADRAPAQGPVFPDHCQDCAFHCAAPPSARAELGPQPELALPRAITLQPPGFRQPRTAARPRAPPTAS
jgi:hypothetical protein